MKKKERNKKTYFGLRGVLYGVTWKTGVLEKRLAMFTVGKFRISIWKKV